MDFSTNSTSININMYIQPVNLPIKDTSDFPSKQAEAIQKNLLELDEQGKLLNYFKEQYQDLGKPNSIANYILEDFENRKHLFIEWTGIEVYKENRTLIKATGIKLNTVSYGSSNKYFLWKCNTCGNEWVAKVNIIKSQQAIIACYFFAYSLSKLVFMWVFQNFQVEWKR